MQNQQQRNVPAVWLSLELLQTLGLPYRLIDRGAAGVVLVELLEESEPVPEEWFLEAVR